jgi:hypothetical protein
MQAMDHSGQLSAIELQEISIDIPVPAPAPAVVMHDDHVQSVVSESSDDTPRSIVTLLHDLESRDDPEEERYCCGLRTQKHEEVQAISREIVQAAEVLTDSQWVILGTWIAARQRRGGIYSQECEKMENRLGDIGIGSFMVAACFGISGVPSWEWLAGVSGLSFVGALITRCCNLKKDRFPILEQAANRQPSLVSMSMRYPVPEAGFMSNDQ